MASLMVEEFLSLLTEAERQNGAIMKVPWFIDWRHPQMFLRKVYGALWAKQG